jgi:hypothetical protein
MISSVLQVALYLIIFKFQVLLIQIEANPIIAASFLTFYGCICTTKMSDIKMGLQLFSWIRKTVEPK